MKSGAEMRPGGSEPDSTRREEERVVKNAARFPEAGGGREEFGEIGIVVGESLEGHGRRIRRPLYWVKYFM